MILPSRGVSGPLCLDVMKLCARASRSVLNIITLFRKNYRPSNQTICSIGVPCSVICHCDKTQYED